MSILKSVIWKPIVLASVGIGIISRGVHSKNKFIKTVSTSLLISNGIGALLGFAAAAGIMTDRISDRQITDQQALIRTFMSPAAGAVSGVVIPAVIAEDSNPIPPTLALTLSYLAMAPGAFLGGIVGGVAGGITGNVLREHNLYFDFSKMKISETDSLLGSSGLCPVRRIAANTALRLNVISA